MAKSTRAEIEARIGEVYKLLLRRDSYRTIVRYGSTKWGVSSRQIDDYIAQARDRLREDATADRLDALAEHLALRKDLYNQAYKAKQWMTGFMILQDEAKLTGLYFSLQDHLKVAIAAGYNCYEPDSPEDQAASTAAAESLSCEVEIGLASPTEGGTPIPEAV
jgi:hypothetical protein